MTLPPFQAVLEDHAAQLYRFLVGQVGIPEAEDCLQETLLAALRAYPRLPEGSNVRAWLFTIAHRKAIDAHRARGRRAVPAGELPEVAVEAPEPPEPGLWRAVATLPPKQRAAVVQRHVNGLPYAEIGLILGCSEEAARQSVSLGLRKLRRAWKS